MVAPRRAASWPSLLARSRSDALKIEGRTKRTSAAFGQSLLAGNLPYSE